MFRRALVGIFLFLSLLAFSADVRNVYYDTDLGSGNNDGTSPANAYWDLLTAENAEDGDISLATGSDEYVIFHLRSTGGNAETGQVDVNGWTTASANYIEFRTASTDRASASGWDNSKFRMSVTDQLAAIRVQENYVRFDGLQAEILYSSGAADNVFYIAGQDAANLIQISNGYIRGDGNGSNDGIRIADVDTILKAWNIIITNVAQYGLQGSDSGAVELYNSVIKGAGVDGVEINAGTFVAKNVASFDNGVDFDDVGADTSTVDFCSSDDDTGTNNIDGNEIDADWTTDFNGAATGDFELLIGSPLFVTGGVDNPGSGLYSTDIEGTAYVSTWPIGVFQPGEAPAPAEQSPVPIIMQQMNQFNGGTLLAISLVINIALVVALIVIVRRRVRPFKDIEEMEAYCEVERLLEGQWEGR